MAKYLVFGSLILASCSSAPPDQPIEHDHPGSAVTVWTDQSELFFEHPSMEAGVQSDVWAVHVTRLDDFSPVTEGSLTLLWQSATGDSDSLTVDQPARPGIFLPTPTIESAGTYDVYVIVGGPQLQDRIPAGRIEVYSDHTDVPHDAQNAVDNSISFLKEQQWPIEFGMTTVTERNVRSSFDVLGTVEAAAGRMAEVAATVDGLLHTESNLETPFEGSLVTKGDILVAPTEATPIQFVL